MNFAADSYQEVSIDWLTVAANMIIGGGQAMLLARDHGTRCAIGCAYIEHKLDLTRPQMKSREKHE